MDSNTESNEFEIREVLEEEESLDPTYGGVLETWEPIRTGPKPFDVQSPGSSEPSQVTYAGEVEIWKRITEGKRWTLACWIMGVLTIWIFVGLIGFLIKEDVRLLSSLAVPALLIKQICDYYFHYPKKRGENSKPNSSVKTWLSWF